MKANIFLYLFIFITLTTKGQVKIRGKVIDKYSKEALAFANIQFNHDPNLIVTSDIDGNFDFRATKTITNLKCSYVGYETTEMTFSVSDQVVLEIKMNPQSTTLDELIITQKENPALAIIRKTIANRKRNNPENIERFRYRCYNKINVDLDVDSLSNVRKKMEAQRLPHNPFFLMESVTTRKFIAPNHSEEVVIASRVSGLKNPSFASLATDIQPFAFYQDNIKLVNVYYLNPISTGSLKKYKYQLQETIAKGTDTVFVISFEPRQKKNFDGLKGVLYINSNQYAIQNVIATPYENAKIHLKIQQQYQWINNQYWFPEQLNYALTINNFSEMKLKMTFNGRSYIDKVELNIPLDKKDFSYEKVKISDNATTQDTAFWNQARHEELTNKELSTYKYLDSLGLKKNFDGYMKMFENLSQNKISYRFLDFDLSKTLQVNKYEGTRLGTGIYTNSLLSKKFSLGGFVGWGTNDNKWKYGGAFSYFLDTKKDFSIGIKHQVNLVEIGNYGLRSYSNNFFNLRTLISSNFDEIRQNSFQLQFRGFRYLTGQLSLNQTTVQPTFAYVALDKSIPFNNYKTTDISFFARYAFQEKIVKTLNSSTSMGSDYPIVYLLLTKGINRLFGSELNYTKIEMATQHAFFTRNFGKTSYRLEAGYIDTLLPLGLMFTGEGSLDHANPYFMKHHFQTMKPYEFVSDAYVNLFFSHNFGTLLFRPSYLRPSISVHQNISWGKIDISNMQSSMNAALNSKENVFLEAGIQVDNILKFNILNLGYFGIGSAVFHRYGYYSNPSLNDNLVYQITFDFTIK